MKTIDNGSPRIPSRLDTLDAAFKAGGGKPSKDAKVLVKAWQTASAAKDAAEAALANAARAQSDAAAALIRGCCGKGRVTIGGVTYVPMSRGETVFLRREGSAEAVDLG